MARELFPVRARPSADRCPGAGGANRERVPAANTAVAGYDLTFSPVKSVSALWAVAPGGGGGDRTGPSGRRPDALAFLEEHALFTRDGPQGSGR